jgi:lipopolysaccharide transport system permease protein
MAKTEPQELVIEAGRGDRHYWTDLWRYRDLLYFLAWRDLLVRYKQTAIGALWALIRPSLTIAVFTVVFGKLAKLPSGGVPYPILVCAAILPWQFFANAFSDAGASLVSNANLISKIFFPRLVIPMSALAVSLADFAVSVLILGALLLWYGAWPDWRVIAAPAFVLLALMGALGAGVWLAALTVKYRDFRHVVPFLLQLGLYISPVGFSSAIIPEPWRLLYSLNPMVGAIDGFRWSLLRGTVELYWPGLLMSWVVVLALLVSGIRYFRRTERYFADII